MTIDIASLRALHAATTPGTWRESGEYIVTANFEVLITETEFKRDAPFIVAAHAEMPKLLDSIEMLQSQLAIALDTATEQQAEVESLRAEVAFWKKQMCRMKCAMRVEHMQAQKRRAK